MKCLNLEAVTLKETDLPVLYYEMPVCCSREASVAYCPTKEHSLKWEMAVEGLGHGKGAVTYRKPTQTHRWAEKFLNKKWLPENEEAACKKTVTHFWYRLQLWQLFFFFLTRSQNCEKRLLPSSCSPVRPSVHPYGTRLPLDRFLWNLIGVIFFRKFVHII